MTTKSLKVAGICFTAMLAFATTIQKTNAAPVSEADNRIFSIAEEYVNIRESANTESPVIGKFYHNNIGEVAGQEGDWYLINSGSVTGYVNSDYVAVGEQAEEIAGEAQHTYAIIETDALYLRAEADMEAPILDMIGEGAKYQILEEQEEWVRVAAGAQEGYLHREYIEEETAYSEAVSMEEDAQANSQGGSEIANYALQFVGNPYVWGGTSLTNGADCSGFVQAVYADFGCNLPRTSRAQADAGTGIGEDEMQPGDLIFYSRGGSINHVAMYIGNGQVVHASTEKTGIKVSDYNYRTPVKIVRYL